MGILEKNRASVSLQMLLSQNVKDTDRNSGIFLPLTKNRVVNDHTVSARSQTNFRSQSDKKNGQPVPYDVH